MMESSVQSPQPPEEQPVRHTVHHSYIWLNGLQIVFAIVFVLAISIWPTIYAALAEEGVRISGLGSLVAIILSFLVFLIIAGLVLGIHILSYKNLSYEIGIKEFSLYSGILNKKKMHVPYQRIQSINQKASLIQRVFGICTVHIDTAGGASNKAVVVPYVRKSDAEVLRAELFMRKQMLLAGHIPSSQPLVAPNRAGAPLSPSSQTVSPASETNILDVPAEVLAGSFGVFDEGEVYTGEARYEVGLGNKELIFTGLSNNTSGALIAFVSIMGFFGLTNQFLGFRVENWLVEEGLYYVEGGAASGLAWLTFAAVVGVALFTWAMSTLGVCLRFGGFKAKRRETRIEVEHGILQHHFYGLDIDRVQSVIIKQSLIRRFLGYAELSLGKIDAIDTSSGNKNTQASAGQGLVIHPFVKMSQIPGILSGLIPEFADIPLESTPLPTIALRRSIIRRGFLYGAGFWATVVIAIAQITINLSFATSAIADAELLSFINTGAIVLYSICLPIFIIEVVGAVLWYKDSSFAYTRTFMQITNGGYSRESLSLPRKKIQFAYTRTNPFQRRANVGTINVVTAAGIGGTKISLLDVKEEDARAWMEWVLPRKGVVR